MVHNFPRVVGVGPIRFLSPVGALDWGGGGGGVSNVPCHYFRNFPVNFKIVQCRLSILRNDNVQCHYFLNFPVDFKIPVVV